MVSKFYNEIKNAKIEKEVELVYKKGISIYFSESNIEHPFGCDGFIDTKFNYNGVTRVLRLLAEFKFDGNLSSKIGKSKVLIQVLYYLKYFENNGRPLPNIILVGDKNECFVIHSNDISCYLDEDLDWSIAPSSAANHNPDLLMKLIENKNINPFVFDINKNFSFSEVVSKIKSLALNIPRHVRVTEQNISVIYDYFISKVIKNAKNIDANKLVYIFIDLMVRPDNTYKHPNKKNTLVLSDGNTIAINSDNFDSFFNYFERKYKPSEKEKFTEISDRLIEDTNRRFKGEFYTPTVWVNEAHKMISESLGDNWREEYCVWDCSWGTGNLTRDYKFKELYCSTLNKTDIYIGERYNKNATKFQYDFLNDDIDLLNEKRLFEGDYKLPQSLLQNLKDDKPILFLINPPYGTANNAGTEKGDHKEGIALTAVNKLMKANGIGASSQQLYAQFLYRILLLKKIYNLTNIKICLFSPTIFLTGPSFEKFRYAYLRNFEFVDGMIFKASNFADVKSNWAIDFSIWSGTDIDESKEYVELFKHKVKDINSNGEIVTIKEKYLYNLDYKDTCSDWIKKEVKGLKTYDYPQMSSALVVKPKGRGKLVKNALGYYVNVGNSIYKNTTDVYIVSGTASTANGISIIDENFEKVMSNFAARKLIIGNFANWENEQDEYCIPNIKHPKYKEWVSDSIIYALFNSRSNQSSLRDVNYAEELWNIKNEFFFMSVNDIEYLADECGNDDIYEDVKYFGEERYVYKKLKEIEISHEAKTVLDKAIELTKKSFRYRNLFNEEKPEYQINTWDAGWYQIKGVLYEYMRDDLNEFNELYKILENKMRPMVYELGFLK